MTFRSKQSFGLGIGPTQVAGVRCLLIAALAVCPAIAQVTGTSTITTIAGQRNAGAFSGDGGLATAARLNFEQYLTGAFVLAFDPSGNLYVADSGNSRVRKISKETEQSIQLRAAGALAFSGMAGLRRKRPSTTPQVSPSMLKAASMSPICATSEYAASRPGAQSARLLAAGGVHLIRCR
jgi:hypothetical protein